MKHSNALELLKISKKQTTKAKKIYLSIGFVCSLMLGTLFSWGGITAFKSIASIETNPIVQEKIKKWNNSIFKDKIPGLETENNKIPELAKVDCWTTAKNLMSIGGWFEKPIAENYNNLKSACL